MNDKEQYYKYVELGIIKHQTPEQRIESLANHLLEVLYKPTKGEQLFIPNWTIIKKLGIDSGEPINWMDLRATVEFKRGIFIINIDEASPSSCPTLCEYIEKYLIAWGWNNIIIETEW